MNEAADQAGGVTGSAAGQGVDSGTGFAEDPGAGFVVGIGVSSRTQADEAATQIAAALARTAAGALTGAPVLAVTTWADKANHPAVRAIADALGVPVEPHDSASLRAQDPGSDRVHALTADNPTGAVGSVARAAVLASGARPLHERRTAGGATYVIGVHGEARTRPAPASDARPHDDSDARPHDDSDARPHDEADAHPCDPLRHHGDAEARGLEIDLAVNVAVPQPPGWLLDAMRAALPGVAAYPDERPTRERLAAHLRLDPEALLLVNGVAEAFTLIARARDWRVPLVVHPQFTEPDAALRAAGYKPAHHVLRADEHFALRPDRVPADADLVVVGNPTNPTSRLHPADDLRALRDAGPEDRLLVLDEAFLDIVPAEPHTLVPEASDNTGLCVMRSLTKTFGLAGVRAGYVVAHPDLIARLRELQPPWSVNAIALAAIDAVTTAPARAHVDALAAQLPHRRDALAAALHDLGFSVVAEAAGPFLLAHHDRGETIRTRLREAGVAVRRADTFPGLGPGWLRFAVRDEATTDRVLSLIRTQSKDPR